MIRIYIQMLQIPFEWFEFGIGWFEPLSNGLNLELDGSNPFRMFRISIRMFRISFEFGLECFKSLSNDLTPFRMVRIYIRMVRIYIRMVRIYIRMLRIPFRWLEFGFEYFESLSNGLNLDTNS